MPRRVSEGSVVDSSHVGTAHPCVSSRKATRRLPLQRMTRCTPSGRGRLKAAHYRVPHRRGTLATMAPLIILGCGYVGTRLARAALADGRTVRVCARSTGRIAPLGALGAEVKYLDAGVPKQLSTVMAGLPGATVVYSIPPVASLPPGQAIRAALQAAYEIGAACFVLFSSSGLYGSQPDDEIS